MSDATQQFERRPLQWNRLELLPPPERDWAIAGWLGMGHVTLLAGLGGIGKSLLAQMIGSALALQRRFVDEIAKPRRVLAWFSEDDHDELWRRQVAIAAHFKVPLSAFTGNLYVESFADRDCTLMDLDLSGRLVATPMYDELCEQIGDYGAEIVILDNVSRMFGGKEADRNQVTRFVASLNAAAAAGAADAAGEGAPGAAVLLLAHPGRALGSEYSGSTAWENAARARLYLADRKPDAKMFDEDEAPTGERRFLARRKANYSARDLRTFHYQNGVLVPEEPAGASGGFVDSLTRRRDERIVLEAFDKLINGLLQQPTDASNTANYLPALILKFGLGQGRTKRDLGDAMRNLMLDGKLKRAVIGKYGANRLPRYGLVLGSAGNDDCTK